MTSNNEPAPQGQSELATAVAAITSGLRGSSDGRRPDGAGFIAFVLATVAANLGSSAELTAGRPGSWEAELVDRLVHGTVGWNDEHLMTYRTAPIEVVVNTENELEDLGLDTTYEASADHIGRHLFGDRYAPILVTMPGQGEVQVRRGQLTVDELEQLEPIDELLGTYRTATTPTINSGSPRPSTPRSPGSGQPIRRRYRTTSRSRSSSSTTPATGTS